MNEITAITNALLSFKLKDYEVKENSNKKGTYCLFDSNNNSLTGWWDYEKLNHFILGYGKAKNEIKTIHSINNGIYLFKAKVSEVESDGKYINIMEEENENKIFCTLYMSNFLTRNSIFWEQPISELKPYEMANILEVWNNFEFYFKTLNQ